ncbi:hypothetical protein [Nostoc sp.]|uniref:hypothetical protein n=1 Tax=Nostoc sp. TaxID=1180 RepID=UPI002FF69D2D
MADSCAQISLEISALRTAVANIKTVKAVNERRDFNHLVNNQRQISQNIAHGFEDIENQLRATNEKLQEIKAYLIRNQKTDK